MASGSAVKDETSKGGRSAKMERRIVYLDLNHIINLAKQEKAGNDGLLTRIKSLATSGAVVFPITAAHIIEISSISKQNQRTDLSETIDAISRGYILRSFQDMMFLEVLEATADFYGRQGVEVAKDIVLMRGYSQAFGEIQVDFTPWRNIDPEKSKIAEAMFWDAALGKAGLDVLLAKHFPKPADQGKEHQEFIIATENDRRSSANKTIKEKEEKCVVGLLQHMIKNFFSAANKLGISMLEITGNPPRKFWTYEFMAGLPTIDVWSKMHVYLYHDPNRPVKVNHVYDIAHLSVALPYCDVVVCDSEMEHVVKQSKLDRRYNVAVFSKLTAALDFLEAVGGAEGRES